MSGSDDSAVVPVGAVAPVDRTVISRAVQSLREFLVVLDDNRILLAEQGDEVGLANGVADITLLVKDLSTISRDARLDAARVLDERWLAEGKMKLRPDGTPNRLPEVEVEGLGRVKVAGGKERRDWESERLLRRVILGAIVDGDGELITGTVMEIAERIFQAVADAIPLGSSVGWKVGKWDAASKSFIGGLRGQGLDPSEYCDEVIKDRIATVPNRAEGSS